MDAGQPLITVNNFVNPVINGPQNFGRIDGVTKGSLNMKMMSELLFGPGLSGRNN